MTTPDPKLAARLARLKDLFDCAMRASDTDARECTLKKAIYLSELDVAYRSNQLITTAEADARVKAAVLAEHNRCVDAIKNARARNTKIGSVEWTLACEMIAAIRSRGVTG